MKILLVYPQYPDTYWSFKHALKLIYKKASFPPLGLLTIASMLPKEWEKKLVNMNAEKLTDKDLQWADYVFLSAMVVQKESSKEVIARCNRLGVKVVAGGPLFTTEHENFPGVDHFVLGEGEITLPLFLKDLADNKLQPMYFSAERPSIEQTPVPMWSLINKNHYASMAMQYSRGCPFDCEFCDIVFLNGRVPRTKSKDQFIRELDAVYESGWKGGLFIVDDNFIGNKNKLKQEILPAVIEWQKAHKYPFTLSTEASINMADDDELLQMMVDAAFNQVFIGIETPNEDSLIECNKNHNTHRDLVAAVKKIQNWGMEVQGGFIVGFDNDPDSIFNNQISFIQKSGIVMAMVGLLNAPRGTRLYKRLQQENRLIDEKDFTGDNMDGSLNFEPKMNREKLINGYNQILDTIYSPKHYYERVKTLLKEYHPPKINKPNRISMRHVHGAINSVLVLGLVERGRRYYWKLVLTTAIRRPKMLPYAVTMWVNGFHFRKVVDNTTHRKQNAKASRKITPQSGMLA